MRLMSFFYTQPQFRARTKDVTRRLGWADLKPGERVQGVVKGQGLKKGEQVERLDVIGVVTVRREPLSAITADDVRREGYPGKTTEWFIEHFCRMNRCSRDRIITRIAFTYQDPPDA